MSDQSEKEFDRSLDKIAKSALSIKPKKVKQQPKKETNEMKKVIITTVIVTLAFVSLLASMFLLGVAYKSNQDQTVRDQVTKQVAELSKQKQ